MRVHCDLSGAGFFYTLGLYKVALGPGTEIRGASARRPPPSERMKQSGTWVATCVLDALCGRCPTFVSQGGQGAIRSGRHDGLPWKFPLRLCVLLCSHPWFSLLACVSNLEWSRHRPWQDPERLASLTAPLGKDHVLRSNGDEGLCPVGCLCRSLCEILHSKQSRYAPVLVCVFRKECCLGRVQSSVLILLGKMQ